MNSRKGKICNLVVFEATKKDQQNCTTNQYFAVAYPQRGSSSTASGGFQKIMFISRKERKQDDSGKNPQSKDKNKQQRADQGLGGF